MSSSWFKIQAPHNLHTVHAGESTPPPSPRPTQTTNAKAKVTDNCSIFSLLALVLIKAKSRNIEQERVEDFSFRILPSTT